MKPSFDDSDDDDFELINGKPILRDGHSFRVPVRLMDGVQRQLRERTGHGTQLHDGYGGSVGFRPGFVVPKDAANVDTRQRAYAAHCDALENAWRGDPPTGFGSHELRGAQEGDICTINGAPGHLRCDSDGKLVCAPDGGKDAALPSTDRAAARTSYIEQLENAWRS